MLNVKLTECGFEQVLDDIADNLESVLGKKVSKKQKDEMIYKALGAIDALYQLVLVTDVNSYTKCETDT